MGNFEAVFWGALMLGAAAGAVVIGLGFWLLPKLWHWLAPIIHNLTA